MSERASCTLFIQILIIAAVAAGAGTLLSIPLSEMFIASGLVICAAQEALANYSYAAVAAAVCASRAWDQCRCDHQFE